MRGMTVIDACIVLQFFFFSNHFVTHQNMNFRLKEFYKLIKFDNYAINKRHVGDTDTFFF